MQEEKNIVQNGQQAPPANFNFLEMEKTIADKHKQISNEATPNMFIEQKNGFDYVDEAYMRNKLNEHYPVWSWEITKYEIIGDVYIAVHGRLSIADRGIARHFDSIAAHRIAKSAKGYVDIGNDMKSANTDAFKVAVNRLCNISDDVYRKLIPDYELTDEQVDKIYKEIANLEDEKQEEIKVAIENNSIHRGNFDAALRKLRATKGETKDV